MADDTPASARDAILELPQKSEMPVWPNGQLPMGRLFQD